MRRSVLVALAAVSSFAFTAPAAAVLVPVSGGACSTTAPNPDASACAGAYAGNLNGGSTIGDLNAALDVLVGGNYSPDITWTQALEDTKLLFTAGAGTTISFDRLFGQNIFSVHFGDGGTGLGNRTTLFLFDFGTTGATSVDLAQRGFSNAVLIRPPVPEPGTWAMMLLGFAGAGIALRRGRRSRSGLPQVA